MKYKLLTISILSSILLTSQDAEAAKYQVTEITPSADYRQQFGLSISDNGDVTGVSTDRFNYPFYNEDYLTTLNCDVSAEERSSGVFDAVSSACIKASLERNVSNASFQKLGEAKSFISRANSSSSELVNLVDVFDSTLNSLTYSNNEYLRAVNSQGIAVGDASAPFDVIFFRQTGENAATEEVKLWQREYPQRAVVYINGEVRTLDPEFTTYGGESAAMDISNTGFVSGYSSVAISSSTQSVIDSRCTGELQPVEVCVWSLEQNNLISGLTNIFQTRPVIWKLDADGNVESSQTLNLAFEPTDTQTGNYYALATTVNDSGLAAGYGHVFRDTTLTVQPLYYRDGETKTFLDDSVYDQGFSVDVNNNGVIVGTAQVFQDRRFNGEFFIYNTETEEFETPTTFYENAESAAHGINDSGKVVGEAEYEITTDSLRRMHGFLYDSVSKEFFDLNSLTECNSDYEIVRANGINNSDQIVATALKLVDRRDALGEVITDSDGNPEKEQVTVTVVLNPTGGEIDDCTVVEEQPQERKGPANSILFTLTLGAFALLRRRFF